MVLLALSQATHGTTNTTHHHHRHHYRRRRHLRYAHVGVKEGNLDKS